MDKNYAKYILSKVNEHYNLVSDKFSRTRDNPWKEIKPLFNKYIKENDSILDLGCGNGRFSEFIENKKNYIGVDNSEELINLAKKRYPEVNFRKENALSTSFFKNQFDVIFSISVLHHFPSKKLRKDFLNECGRILKTKGILIITVWDLTKKKRIRRISFKNSLLKLIGRSKLDFNDALIDWHGISKCFVHLFKENELKSLVSDSGFKIIDFGVIKINNKKCLSNFFIVAQKKS